jgi:hypothetical protein
MFSKNNGCLLVRQVKSAKVTRLPKLADRFPLVPSGGTDPVAGAS